MYKNAAEVARDGLRLPAAEHEWKAELARRVKTGMSQLRAGEMPAARGKGTSEAL